MATDRFAMAGNLLKIKNKYKTIYGLAVTEQKTAYGTVLIPSKNNENHYTWNLKIEGFGCGEPFAGVDIGIQDSKLDTRETEFYHTAPAYCFQSVGKTGINGKLEIVSAVFEEKDIVTLQLDMKNRTIKYLVNDEDTGIIINDIDQKQDLQYRLAVTVRGTGTVTLLDFQINNIVKDDAKSHDNDDIYHRYDGLQNEMVKETTLIKSYENQIDVLTKKLNDLSSQREEKKMDNNALNIEKISIDLENEFVIFKQQYNGDKLQEIFDKSPDNVINKESALNIQYKKYKQRVDKIIVSSEAFGKYIQDIDEIINKLSMPDVKNYKSWDIKQILIWIQGLEDGRFKKHIEKLKNGLEKSEIIGEDLPDLKRNDLSAQPFDIGNFRDRKQLEMHFQSLKINQSADEGSTAYI